MMLKYGDKTLKTLTFKNENNCKMGRILGVE